MPLIPQDDRVRTPRTLGALAKSLSDYLPQKLGQVRKNGRRARSISGAKRPRRTR